MLFLGLALDLSKFTIYSHGTHTVTAASVRQRGQEAGEGNQECVLWGWGTFTEWLDCRGQVCSWLIGCGGPGDICAQEGYNALCWASLERCLEAIAATLPLPGLHPTENQPSSTSNQVSQHHPLKTRPPFFRNGAPTHPSQEADLRDRPSIWHHPLPGTGEPANGPAQGTEALLSWKAGPTLFLLT